MEEVLVFDSDFVEQAKRIKPKIIKKYRVIVRESPNEESRNDRGNPSIMKYTHCSFEFRTTFSSMLF